MAIVMEVDGLTGDITDREMTADEKAQRAADEAAYAQVVAEREAADMARATALAKIAAASGLTPDEFSALGL